MQIEIRYFLIVTLAILMTACEVGVNLEKEKALLMASNERQRQAHMENDAQLLAEEMADTVLTVQRGQFRRESREDMQVRWKQYFSSVKYSAWDDLEPPAVELSTDGKLATVAVRKVTIASFEGEAQDTTYFAWTSAYRKLGGQWLIYSVTSTRVAQ